MDKKVQNYLAFGQKELHGKEICSDIMLNMIPAIFYGVFRFSRLRISFLSIMIIIVIIILGIGAVSKKSSYVINLYRGVAALGNAIHWFMLSVLLTIANGANVFVTITAFGVTISVICIVICRRIDQLIEKDAYNTEYKQATKGSAYTGSFLAVVLCPVIFSNMSQNSVYAIIAFCSLVLGTLMLLGVNYIKKAMIYRKMQL